MHIAEKSIHIDESKGQIISLPKNYSQVCSYNKKNISNRFFCHSYPSCHLILTLLLILSKSRFSTCVTSLALDSIGNCK